ncbi:MAG: hypothetical protein ACP5E4_01360 [Candidatus Aenigmatarchaeota archaeon]
MTANRKGYFFTLEALFAALILMSSVLIINFSQPPQDGREEKIYRALALLEDEGKLRHLTDEKIEAELEGLLGFDVKVNPDSGAGAFVQYFLATGPENFEVMRIYYRQP